MKHEPGTRCRTRRVGAKVALAPSGDGHPVRGPRPRDITPQARGREKTMETNRQKVVEQSTPAAPDQLPARAKGLSRKQLYAMGKELRNACPRRSRARWKAARGRPDAVRLVLAAAVIRGCRA